MDDETAIKLLREIVDVGPLPTDEPETHPLMEAALAAFLELQRYREREPLVQRLLDCNTLTELRCLTKDVRDFKLSASAAEGDESA